MDGKHAHQPSVAVSPGLYQQFEHLKTVGHFQSDQDLFKAALQALEREQSSQFSYYNASGFRPSQPYMQHPGLAPEDYDT